MVNALRQLQLDDLCVHQVTLSGQCDFANSLAVLRNAGIKRTALWTPMINSCGISEAKRIWDSAGMTAESLCVACLFEDEALLREQLDLDRGDARHHKHLRQQPVGHVGPAIEEEPHRG